MLAEPKAYHPLVGFGVIANKIEKIFNRGNDIYTKFFGVWALLVTLWPFYIACFVFYFLNFESIVVDSIILYLAIGRKSLLQHAVAIETALKQNDILQARKKLSYIVSRDTHGLSMVDVSKATIESLVENSNDAIYGAIFWYLVAGAPAVVFYRLINTLDAMWGYKNTRYINFGWAAARLDDVLNYMPARLTVLSFALLAVAKKQSFYKVLKQAFQQGKLCSSFNAGPVMAAGALVLNIRLGGEACYGGVNINKPLLGRGREASENDIERAMILVNQACYLWLMFFWGAAIVETWWPVISGR